MTTVIAHRGARSLAPENTLTAARLGHAIGADLWETDVNITRDNQLILFHDPTLDRCTDVRNKFPERASTRVSDYTLDEILTLDCGSFYAQTDPFGQIRQGRLSDTQLATYQGLVIPTLKQGLSLVKELNWCVNLELKCYAEDKTDFRLVETTIDQVQQSGLTKEQVKISSFNHTWLDWVKQMAPDLEIQALVGDKTDHLLTFDEFSFQTYNAKADLITDDQIRMLQSKGKKINLFTVNDPDHFRRFAALGVTGIFTDFPQRFCNRD